MPCLASHSNVVDGALVVSRLREARAELELAARLCANQGERSVLLHKAAALG
jgi:hypothetical protein